MFIEEALIPYRVLGIWTLTLLYERYRFNYKIEKMINNNTIAMTKVYEVIEKWER